MVGKLLNKNVMKKKFYKYGLFYIGVVLAACADNADLNEPTGSTTPPSGVECDGKESAWCSNYLL